MPLIVTVHYPFHPLYKHSLKPTVWPRRSDGTATVCHPDGKPLKIPLWMLQTEAAQLHLKEQPEIPFNARLTLEETLRECSTVKANDSQEHHHATSHPRPRTD